MGVGTITTGFVLKTILVDRVRRTEYFQTAMKITRQHEGWLTTFHSSIRLTFPNFSISGAKALLGEPIKETSFEYGKPNYADAEKAYFEVHIKGPKAKGILYFWANKPKEAEHWDVSRIEFQLRDDDTRRLVIKKPSTEETESLNE